MGKIKYYSWIIETELNISFKYKKNKYTVQGIVSVESVFDSIDEYKTVIMPLENDSENNDSDYSPLVIKKNGKSLTDDEQEIYETIYDIVYDMLIEKISIKKTDLTNNDFRKLENVYPNLDNL